MLVNPTSFHERSILARDDLIQLEGVVTRVLGRGGMEIECDNNVTVRAVLSGRMKKSRIRVIEGDRVQVSVSPYDTSHGIITYRYKWWADSETRDSRSSLLRRELYRRNPCIENCIEISWEKWGISSIFEILRPAERGRGMLPRPLFLSRVLWWPKSRESRPRGPGLIIPDGSPISKFNNLSLYQPRFNRTVPHCWMGFGNY